MDAVDVIHDDVETSDGIRVRVRVERRSSRAGGHLYLDDRAIVIARHRGCGDLSALVRVGSYYVALGRQDERVGHAAFDDRYLVKTRQLAALRYWLSEVEADAMLASYDPTSRVPWELRVTPDELRLERRERQVAERDVEWSRALIKYGDLSPWARLITDTDRAVRTVAILARRGERLAAAWRDRLMPFGLTATEPVWSTDDRYGATLAHGRARIRVDFPWRMAPLRAAGLRTRLTIEWPHQGTAAVWPTSWRRRERPRIPGSDAHAVAGWRAVAVDTDVLATLPALGAALTEAGVDWLVATPRRLALGWERIVEDSARLAAACALLRGWSEAAAPSGPYR